MRWFEFDSPLSQEEIYSRLERYAEAEPHSMWAIVDSFHSPRKGLHLYFQNDIVVGYYETGEASRGRLNVVKSWLRMRIKEEKGNRRIRAATFLSPIMGLFGSALLLPELCLAMITRDIEYLGVFVIAGSILAVLLWHALKEQKEIEVFLRRMLQEIPKQK